MCKGLYAEDLIKMTSCGCSEPGCNNNPKWFHSKCHPQAGLTAIFEDKIMIIHCITCLKDRISIVSDSIVFHRTLKTLTLKEDLIVVDTTLIVCPSKQCHVGAGLLIMHINGKIIIHCKECKRLIASVNVAKRNTN